LKTKEFTWKASDQLELSGKYWSPDSSVKAVIALVHGMGEHINRYEPFAADMVNAGFAVIGFDQRGHGRSEGQRGHSPNYELLMQSIDDLLHKAGEFFPEIPVFLMGHSLGGQLVLNYCLDRKPNVKGVIASSPFLKLAFDPPAWKITLGKLVLNIFPSLPQSTALETAAISRVEAEVKKYEADKLVHDRITPAMYFGIMEKAEYALQHASEWILPLLMYHGTADRLTSPEGTKEFASKVKGDITLKLFEGGYHETHHDLNREALISMLINWLIGKL
jgi:acylglycerol lipase